MVENEIETLATTSKPLVSKKSKLAFLLVITAILVGITVWSINGTYTISIHHNIGDGVYGDEVKTIPVDPVIQGILAIITFIFLIRSISTLISYHNDELIREIKKEGNG